MGYVIVPKYAVGNGRRGPFLSKCETKYVDSINHAKFFLYRDRAEDWCTSNEAVVSLDTLFPEVAP